MGGLPLPGPLASLYREDPEELRAWIEQTLRAVGGSPGRAAKALGVSVPNLWLFLRRLGMAERPAQIREVVRGRFVL